LMQEIDSSDIFDTGQEARRGQLLFSKSARYEISAVYQGELRTAYATTDNLSTGFKFAFEELQKSAGKLPINVKPISLASAHPLSAGEISQVEAVIKKPLVFAGVETADSPPLLAKAVTKPDRLIAAEDEKDYGKLSDFLSSHHIQKTRSGYYLSTSRGKYRIDTLQLNRR